MDSILLTTALALLGASALGAALPLFRRWSERGLHLFVALSAGIFLGTIFFHLLPHLAGVDHGDAHAHAHVAGAEDIAHSIWPWGAALLGILLLFLLEKVWLPSHTRGASSNPHAMLWSATYVGLALHAATAGIALSGILEMPEGRGQFLASILVHKATECFSLATVMRLAGLPTSRSVVLLALFALIEPAGLMLGGELAAAMPAAAPILTGFACGTFLYVAVADLLPEVFHGAGSTRVKVGAVLAGVAIPTLTLERVEAIGIFARQALLEAGDVFLDMAPYLLVGFALAGVVRLLLKPERVAPRLGGNDLRSVGWAALIGAPLPLCSCSVIPVALSLRKAGASKGATSAFTVSTPETGVDSLAVTWALLDPLLTIARPIGALVSAVVSGSAVNWLVRRGLDVPNATPTPQPAESCCAHEVAPPPVEKSCCAAEETKIAASAVPDEHAGHGHAALPKGDRPERTASFLERALRYGFVDMLDDLAPSLLLGLLVSGVIVAAIPDGALENPLAHGPAGYFLMLAAGIPLYVCASASTPIAAALILKGLSPGAAFVFLLAGPATNAASLIVLSRALGARVVAVQVAALSICALALGFAVDQIYALLGIAPSVATSTAHEHGPTWLSYGSAAVLAVLLFTSLVRTHGTRDLLATLREGPTPA
ncbi:MAG: SO_0444 family Cu/Zn efflux transporter [Planctomycetota bacterium]|nr:SO_0444 family Cu/Zn efflux transporter [Planctomycetota bacterium]